MKPKKTYSRGGGRLSSMHAVFYPIAAEFDFAKNSLDYQGSETYIAARRKTTSKFIHKAIMRISSRGLRIKIGNARYPVSNDPALVLKRAIYVATEERKNDTSDKTKLAQIARVAQFCKYISTQTPPRDGKGYVTSSEQWSFIRDVASRYEKH